VYRIEQERFQAAHAKRPISKKAPGMALQNLHPRFKSGQAPPKSFGKFDCSYIGNTIECLVDGLKWTRNRASRVNANAVNH
jgi:hypothetical protein